MATVGLHDRIRQRLEATGKSARRASLDAGLSEDAISKILRLKEHSQTLATVEKLAKGLDTSPMWLAYGTDPTATSGSGTCDADASRLLINLDLFRQVLMFVLKHEGVPAPRAEALADILPEALSGPPVDAVERDPFLSFRVHFQLGEKRSEPRSTQ